jgi:hypothetical protein
MLLNREEFGKKEGFKAKAGDQDAPDFELEWSINKKTT